MIDIIGHFFILYPLFTFNKDSSIITKSTIFKFAINIGILGFVAVLTNVYLMDSSIVTEDRRE